MELASIFLFRFFGFYLFFMGGALMLRSTEIRQSFNDFIQNRGLLLFSGIINLLLGLALVLNYNVWEFSAKGFVSLLCWIVLIKGIVRIFFPNSGLDFGRKMMSGNIPLLMGGIKFLVGVWLLWEGYTA